MKPVRLRKRKKVKTFRCAWRKQAGSADSPCALFCWSTKQERDDHELVFHSIFKCSSQMESMSWGSNKIPAHVSHVWMYEDGTVEEVKPEEIVDAVEVLSIE